MTAAGGGCGDGGVRGRGEVAAVMAEMVVGATAAVTNTSDLTSVRIRNLNFFK